MYKEKSMYKSLNRIRKSLKRRMDGGEGSGNWGHAGRPGEVGGSAEGGGKHNRQKDFQDNFTSFSRERKKAAQVHALSAGDLKAAQDNWDVIIVDSEGNHYRNTIGTNFFCKETGKIRKFKEGESVKVIIPNSMNPNYKVTKDDRNAMKLSRTQMDKAFNPDTRKEADDKYRAQSGEVWNSCPQSTKDALVGYTSSGYKTINKSLRGADSDTTSLTQKRINAITKAINKSEFKEDVVLYRGIDEEAAEKMLGLPRGYLNPDKHMRMSNMNLVGRIGTDDGFMSCGSSQGTGFSFKNVSLEIMCPKGTKGLYAEPFSEMGNGDTDWDGHSPQSDFSRECETILQRGTTLQVIGYEMTKANGTVKHKIKVAVVRQDYANSEYEKVMAKKKPKKKSA